MTLVFPLISKYVHVHFTMKICFGILYSVDCVGEGGGGGGSALAQVCTALHLYNTLYTMLILWCIEPFRQKNKDELIA